MSAVEDEVKPKRRGRPPKAKTEKAVKAPHQRDLLLRINAFIPNQEPEEIVLTVKGFAGNAFGRQKTAAGIREALKKALQTVYGGHVV